MNALVPNRRKSRGLDDLSLRIGDITREIDRRIRAGSPVRILEVGCGYGVALLQLRHRYGSQVDLHGINRSPTHGDTRTMKAIAAKRGLHTDSESNGLALPRIHYFDVCAPWPLPSDSFDLVFSQHAFLWFDDKIKPLEEINRVITDNGIALLDLRVTRSKSTHKSSIVIQDGARATSFRAYLQQFGNIDIKSSFQARYGDMWRWVRRRLGFQGAPRKARSRLQMRKSANLDFNLEFLAANPFSATCPGRKGCQSIYRLKAS